MNQINMKLEGHLRLTEKLKALGLPPAAKRKLHIRMADAIARAMKREVRKFVEASPLELFDGSKPARKRKARYFASQVGRRATADNGIVFDRRRKAPAKKSDRATEPQAARMKELGFRMSKARIKRNFSANLAGMVIHKIETSRGLESSRRRRRSKFRRGSLLLLVWREQETEILATVNLDKIVRGFLRERLAAA